MAVLSGKALSKKRDRIEFYYVAYLFIIPTKWEIFCDGKKARIFGKAPKTTKIVVTCPGVNLVLSKIICPNRQTKPANIKAFI